MLDATNLWQTKSSLVTINRRNAQSIRVDVPLNVVASILNGRIASVQVLRVEVLRVAKVRELDEIYNEGAQDVGLSQNNIFVSLV